MAIHIKAGTSKKLGLPGYSSQSAWVEIETELSHHELQQAERLETEIAHLFEIAQTAVNEQLRMAYRESSETDEGPLVTPAQMKAIHELSQSRNLDLERLLQERYFGHSLDELTLRQGGQLINWLQTNSRVRMN